MRGGKLGRELGIVAGSERMIRHIRRRSQRPMRPPSGMNYYRFLLDELELYQL